MLWNQFEEYGFVLQGDKTRPVHTIAYEMIRGSIPEGLEPDHLCFNKACFCPAHIEPVTHQENCIRSVKARCKPNTEPLEQSEDIILPLRLPPVVNDAMSIEALQVFVSDVLLTGIGNQGTRKIYRTCLFQFLDWTVTASMSFTRANVQTYLATLRETGKAGSTRNIALAAIRRLAKEAYYAGKLPNEVYLGINDIKGEKKRTVRAAQWLTLRQVNELLSLPDVTTLKGLRDRAMLGVLVGCGLRRAEVCDLTNESIEQRAGRWIFVVHGKGEKTRIVGIAPGLKVSLDEWLNARPLMESRAILFCATQRGGRLVSRKLTPQSIQDIVQEYSVKLDPPLPKLAPHDLRRTHARLARETGLDLEQIQFALGHESISTTAVYLGNNQNLNRTPSDVLDVDWQGGKK